MNKKSLFAAAAVLVMLGGVAWAAEEEKKPAAPAESAPVKVDVTKKEQIEAALDKEAVVSGTVESTRWTASGNTLIVMFKDGPEDFRMVGYGKNREELDKAFEGDIAKALQGKKVEVTSTVKKYKGSVENWKKFTQIVVVKPEQIKVVEDKKKD